MRAMRLLRKAAPISISLLLLVSLNSTCAAAMGNGDGGGVALLFGILVFAGLGPLALLVAAASPLFVRRASVATSQFKLHTVLWGIAASLLALVLAAILANVGPGGQLLAVLLALTWFGLGAMGFSGFAFNAGERLLARDGTGLPSRPVISTLTGLIVCGWVFAVPIVGGLLALAALVVGTGASLQALFKGGRMDESMSDAGAPPPPGARPQITSLAPPTIVSEPQPAPAVAGAAPATAAVPTAPPAQVQATAPPPPPPALERQEGVLDVNLDDEADGEPGGEEPLAQEGQEQ